MSEKRDAILRAMLEVVAERGLEDAPMALVAKRAGASAGVIYNYFSGKDDLLRTLYVQVKTAALAEMNAAALGTGSPSETFARMWLNAYRYFATHRAEALFIDRFEGTPGYKTPQLLTLLEEEPNYTGLLRWLGTEPIRPLLKDLPTGIIYELSFAVAARMVVRREPLEDALQAQVAAACWQAIAR